MYSPSGKLVIQQFLPDEIGDLVWNGSSWVDNNEADGIGVELPESITFTGELNVGGKVIYGLSEGGWRPPSIGYYRITFYLPNNEGKIFSFDASTKIRPLATEGAGGKATVDWQNNLTYIDVRVVAGGGGGSKRNH